MKAEERHRLQENTLAKGMTTLAKQTKSASSTFWGILLLLVIVVACFYWWTRNTNSRLARDWVQFWDSRSAPERLEFTPKEDLLETMERFETTPAGPAAKLTYADQLYEKGFRETFRKSPDEAAGYFKSAAQAYEELAKLSGQPRDISVRALLGAGKSYESLGDLKQALHYFGEVETRFGNQLKAADGTMHPLLAEAQKHVQRLSGSEATFYQKTNDHDAWPQRLPKTTRTEPRPPTPPGEALPGEAAKPPAEGGPIPPASPLKPAEAPEKPGTEAPAKPPEKPTETTPKPPETPPKPPA